MSLPPPTLSAPTRRIALPHLTSPYLVLLIGVLAVSTASTLIRFAQEGDAPSLVIAAARLSIAALLLTPFALRNHADQLRRLSRRDLALALGAGALLALHFASWITSLEYVSVLVSVVLVTTNPLWVALLAPLLLKEPLQRRTLISIGVAFVGGILISLSGASGAAVPESAPLLGSALAVIGAISAALYLIIGRRLRATLSLVPYIWLVYGAAAIVMLVVVAFSGLPLTGYASQTYLWLLLVAIIPQLIGHSTFNYALAHVSAAFVSLVTLGEPIGSAILAYFLLREVPTGIQVAGAGLILLGVGLARRRAENTSPSPATAQPEIPPAD